MHAIMYGSAMFMNVCFRPESKSLTGAGKLTPGLMLENRFLPPLGMRVARIPVGEDNSVGE